jgi:hypothetical protein
MVRPVNGRNYDSFIFGQYFESTVNGAAAADGKTETTWEGLGIVPYFMWNAVETPECVYYGANFRDYIGHIDTKITMVRPVNGRNYDSFIFGQYFDSTVNGAAAADEATQKAIDAINRLPETVSLADKALVAEARALFDLISTLEQKALVTNQAKLTQAEKRIADLEFLQNEQATQPTEPAEPGNDSGDATGLIITLAVVVVIAIAGGALVLRKGKKAPAAAAETAEETTEAETQEQTAEPAPETTDEA